MLRDVLLVFDGFVADGLLGGGRRGSNLRHPGKNFRSNSTAARVSRVGTSPQHTITTSGSPPRSLLAHGQMPMPAVQCLMAASMSSHCGAGCFPATITFT